ncbi:hypothetical protein JZ751_008640 [Albula glossodonta]|uniref:Uncharacterized protein n=1 Tax=Albula glossodonta TaxID=121402 RepID=A0A8T2P177_9TELE|nr:hypothetical protein JZ751_008640 [Albula glossodonta]
MDGPPGEREGKMAKKRQRLQEKLFSDHCLEGSRSPRQVSVAEKSGEGPHRAEPLAGSPCVTTAGEPPADPCVTTPAPSHTPATEVWDMPHTGEKVFVFRFQPEPQDSTERMGRKRGKKRNFLNFKKGSIAPQDQ